MRLGALISNILPSTKTCEIDLSLPNRSPLTTVRFAIFPTSIEPRRSATPNISAALSVIARTAASFDRPFSVALTAFAKKSLLVAAPPLWNENCRRRSKLARDLAFARSPFPFSGAAAGEEAAVRLGKFSDNSNGTFCSCKRPLAASHHVDGDHRVRLYSFARSRALEFRSRCRGKDNASAEDDIIMRFERSVRRDAAFHADLWQTSQNCRAFASLNICRRAEMLRQRTRILPGIVLT